MKFAAAKLFIMKKYLNYHVKNIDMIQGYKFKKNE